MQDANSVSTLYGISSADGVTPIKLQIDPVTGRVLADITIIADSVPVLSGANAVKDANSVSTLLCRKADDSGNLVPGIDNINSQLFVDILIE